jgi:hypothetical protein
MLSKSDRMKKGSTTAALDESVDHDSQIRPVETLTEAQIRAREQEKAQLAEFALARQGQDAGPRARRGKSRDDLAAQGDYVEPQAADDLVVSVIDEVVAPIQGTETDDEAVAAFQATIDALATLRRNREIEKVESKKSFEAEEQRLLAERDEVQRGLERKRQLSAQRDVKAHVQAVRNQAQAERPADPADRRGDYHKKFLAQAAPLLASVRATQTELAAFAKSTVPSLKSIAALSEDDVPVSWQHHHRTRLIGLAQTAGNLMGEYNSFVTQATRVVHAAERLLAQEMISDDVDQRTRCNGLLRDLGYAGQGVMDHLCTRADNIVSAFAQVRKDGEEFGRKGEPVVIVLNPPDLGREALRKGHHRLFKPEPKREPGPLDSLGIDAGVPPSI